MNIIEAIKSGKRFRRAGQTAWHDPPCQNYPLLNGVSRENLLADDWELEPISVTITREQFDKAWEKAWGKFVTERNEQQQDLRNIVATELGL